MENQHRQIKGYRELSQDEIDLMNEVKAFGPQLEDLIARLQKHITNQYQQVQDNNEEIGRLNNANPLGWSLQGKQKLQEGLMCLTRAIAQPGFF